MNQESKSGSVLEGKATLLKEVVSAALMGNTTSVTEGELSGNPYYLTAAPIPSTGWALVSAYNEEITRQPAVLLQAGKYHGCYGIY